MKIHRKHIAFVSTEDWFFRSHFMPLHDAVQSMGDGNETHVICNIADAYKDLEAAGIKVSPFPFRRRSTNPLAALKQIWCLRQQIRRTRPDIVHFIALRPVLIGGLATLFSLPKAKVFHVTGLGTIAEGTSLRAKLFRSIAFRLVSFYLRSRDTHLVVENPDDLAFLKQYGGICDERVSLFGGAGVDPESWQSLPFAGGDILRAAFVGRMIWTKGVDVLIESMKILHKRGVALELDLYGEPDEGNPKSYSREQIESWAAMPNVTWHGRTSDVTAVWRRADISVVSTRTREGMPRAMLEAAACGRPQIVTDVPGPRHFVEDGREGFVVPPEDPVALADALERLVQDETLRVKMGEAARQRVLDGFTETRVRDKVHQIYERLLDA